MRDYITVGPAPCEEDCAQLGSDNYREKAMAECLRYIRLIRKTLGPEPDGARLAVKWFPHDFGTYAEVVVYFDTDNEEATEYAFKVEGESPVRWDSEEVEA